MLLWKTFSYIVGCCSQCNHLENRFSVAVSALMWIEFHWGVLPIRKSSGCECYFSIIRKQNLLLKGNMQAHVMYTYGRKVLTHPLSYLCMSQSQVHQRPTCAPEGSRQLWQVLPFPCDSYLSLHYSTLFCLIDVQLLESVSVYVHVCSYVYLHQLHVQNYMLL